MLLSNRFSDYFDGEVPFIFPKEFPFIEQEDDTEEEGE